MIAINDINIACFTSCAKTLSFSATAVELSITHQAVSRNIQKLEDEVGYKLFVRNNQTVSLTIAGKLFLGWIKDMDARLEWANDYFYYEQIDSKLRLRIAFVDWLGLPKSVQDAITQMEDSRPELDIEIYTGPESFLFQLAKDQKADVLIVPEHEPFSKQVFPDVFTTPLEGMQSLALFYSSDCIASDGSVDYDLLLTKKLLLCDCVELLKAQAGRLYRELCSAHGCQPSGTEYLPNFDSVISEVVMGNGITLAPLKAVMTQKPGALINMETLDDFNDSRVSMSCVWRLSQVSEPVLNFIERIHCE